MSTIKRRGAIDSQKSIFSHPLAHFILKHNQLIIITTKKDDERKIVLVVIFVPFLKKD